MTVLARLSRLLPQPPGRTALAAAPNMSGVPAVPDTIPTWAALIARKVIASLHAVAAPAPIEGPETVVRPGATGRIALVGAGPGAKDLLTLRAVRRLQEADVIFYDRLVDEEVLDLARPEAERIFVGKHVGAHKWPQDRINQVIVAEARKGRRVVRLKSGDPGIFGRATEEIAAAEAFGIPVELVPGVTAVSAAGAMLGRSLTERNVSDTLVLTTGTGCVNDPLPDSARMSGPGTTTAFYMGVRQADRLATKLMQRGLPGHAPVDIAIEVSKPGQRHLTATIETLSDVIARSEIEGCAILLVTWPKTLAASHSLDAEHAQPEARVSA